MQYAPAVAAFRGLFVGGVTNVVSMGNVSSIRSGQPGVLEFFAGVGLARIGLESSGFRVAWANDCSSDKQLLYDAQFSETPRDHEFKLADIGAVSIDDLPRGAALAWASSPCTDLSLAGGRAGLSGSQSGVFWEFVRLLRDLDAERPPVTVLENVTGIATSRGGDDLASAIRAFNDLGYSIDVLSIDARRFVPQSRPRLFLVGALHPPGEGSESGQSELRPDWLQWVFGDESLRTHRAQLPPPPAPLTEGLKDLIEEVPLDDPRWWNSERTNAFCDSLSPTQRERIATLRTGRVKYRTAYRRTRRGDAVWEVRPDDISGCLRTARGGSSKQAVVRLSPKSLKVRWMTPLEYARLMGANDFELGTARTNQALFGFGDAVAVPVVSWLAKHYLMPLVQGTLEESTIEMPEAING